MTALGARDVANLETRNHTNIGLSNHKNHYRSGVKLANWVEEEYGDYLLAQEGGRPVANTSSVCQTSFVAPPPDAHLTHRGVRSDATGTAVPLDMLFYHGPEYQKTSYATLNELTIGQEGPAKRNVNEVLADPNPQGKVATYKALPAVRGSNWKTTYQVDMVDKSAASSKATKGRTQTFTKQFDHGALFPQNNPFRDA